MQYLLLMYDDEKAWADLPEEDQRRIYAEYGAFTSQIEKSGHYRTGEELRTTAHARTVRVRGGRTLTSQGPFAETRLQLGGFYVIEARDLEEASAIAAAVPGARTGCVEVRPIVSR